MNDPVSSPSLAPAPVVIVGAGLAGCLMAVLFRRRGYPVQIYERRPDMRIAQIGAGRSINLALSTRGIDALERAGLADRVMAEAIPMAGRMMHGVGGQLTFQSYGQAGQAINSVSRRGLNVLLMNAAEELGAELFFEHRCVDVDLVTGSAAFETGDGHKQAASRLVVGADGIFSAVRGKLQRTDRYDYEQSYLSSGYKELTIPPTESGGYRLPQAGALHIWPRHDFMLIALPNADCSFTCTLFAPLDGVDGLLALDTPDKVIAYFNRYFPDAVPLMPTLVDDFFANPTSSLCTVRCAPYHSADKVLLIGDAAHAVVPFYGQGMNAAFEDCAILDRMLDEVGDDFGLLLRRFSAERKDDADAIRRLALDNFLEMRSKVADPLFLLQKKLDKVLHKLAPTVYQPLYGMVTFTTIPYAEAVRRAQVQSVWLKRCFVAAGLAALMAVWAVAA
jgi:kynurenine 3-monooxygenase